ncbi:hypothetical protein A3C23_02220 [Candidatus Roizmanbacteria bacterium RIFCSPHIGHO2_02_FULL_37_13b]|uniref:L,D-TPase catalytic domain-containing protein n=1 Tax=Candidatus Roizmanbacteria bacterium RIFCSPLOWO2_02_FULL_36_11 TaxID=1802071 RepID=A0A1F7JGL9_9BACT|nr:MAG: hypothetical protein A3C23_02220 [Candidatus Roizmanbacteria bacterium RIFCSPHIGHO2_02_FULL_37_13b]OGK54757.1 MAG: hypothetical protein A3H78_05710 [Candidatus Roizmanbacteria bacterium RIFCSPLOWO2_02_FULL_36_11]
MVRRKRKKNIHFILRYPINLIVILTLVGLIYPVVSKNYSMPCANSLSCEESLKFKVENNAVGIFENQKVNTPNIDLSPGIGNQSVLGESNATGEKHIYVNLATQTLSAYQGDTLFMQTLISSGLWGKTPTGDFTIWIKIRSTTMSGGSGADYYNLPNVPYVMFFSNNQVPASAGFSLHGTYWHNNFGHRMSHGCVNMKTTDVAKLYEWADPPTAGNTTRANDTNPGTKVTIIKGS